MVILLGLGLYGKFSKFGPEVAFWNFRIILVKLNLTFNLYVLAYFKTFDAIFNFIAKPEVVQKFWNFFIVKYF